MSRINGDSARPKRKIMATDRVTDPSNEATPILSSHQAAADAAEAKRLAKAAVARLQADVETAATRAKPPAVCNTSAAALSPNPTFFSDLKKRSAKNAELSGSDVSPESGEKFTGATEGTLTDLFTDITYFIEYILDESGEQSEISGTDAPQKRRRSKVCQMFKNRMCNGLLLNSL